MSSSGELSGKQPSPLEHYMDDADFQIDNSVRLVEAGRLLPRNPNESPISVALRVTAENIVHDTVPPKTEETEGITAPDIEKGAVLLEAERPSKKLKITEEAKLPDPDYALPMFSLSKAAGRQPNEVAESVARDLNIHFFERVEAAGPYVNVKLADRPLIDGIKKIAEDEGHHGRLADHEGEVAIVDLSAPNVAKPFGVNHLRSTVIGEAVARLLGATGYTVLRDNHLGDWGTQFGNILAAHDTFAPDKEFASLTIDEINNLYIRFNEEVKKEEKQGLQHLKKKGQGFQYELEIKSNPELMEKWAAALALSKRELAAIYKRLGNNFDTEIGERYFVEASSSLVDTLVDELPDLVERDDNGSIYIKKVDPIGTDSKKGKPPAGLKTAAGYTLYGARDLATVNFRTRTYEPDVILYVVGGDQNSFERIFEVANEAGLNEKPDGSKTALEHVQFGMLLTVDEKGHKKKMSTREGTSNKLGDLLAELDEQAFKVTRARHPDLPDDKVLDIAQKIAVGALIWNDLRTERKSSVVFDKKRMLELGNQSVIDVLYSYSRSSSILDRVDNNAESTDKELPSQFSTETEHQLAVRLNEFSDVIRKSAHQRAPHILVRYLLELSQIHGTFYEESRVHGINDASLAQLRINLHRAYKTVVGNGLTLLNIPITERI